MLKKLMVFVNLGLIFIVLVGCGSKTKSADDDIHLINDGGSQSEAKKSSSKASKTSSESATSSSSETATSDNPLGKTPNASYDGSQDFAAHFAIVFFTFDKAKIDTILPYANDDVKEKISKALEKETKQEPKDLVPESAAKFDDDSSAYVFSCKTQDGKQTIRAYLKTQLIDGQAQIIDLNYAFYD